MIPPKDQQELERMLNAAESRDRLLRQLEKVTKLFYKGTWRDFDCAITEAKTLLQQERGDERCDTAKTATVSSVKLDTKDCSQEVSSNAAEETKAADSSWVAPSGARITWDEIQSLQSQLDAANKEIQWRKADREYATRWHLEEAAKLGLANKEIKHLRQIIDRLTK